MDAVLLLGLTDCEEILFISSIGSISHSVGVGDLMLSEYAYDGSGAGRYLSEDVDTDTFGTICHPNTALYQRLREASRSECGLQGVPMHIVHPFCTDTIIAQERALCRGKRLGADALDMESAALFRAAEGSDIAAAAMLQTSDLVETGKASFDNRADAETMECRRSVQRNVMSAILRKVFENGT